MSDDNHDQSTSSSPPSALLQRLGLPPLSLFDMVEFKTIGKQPKLLSRLTSDKETLDEDLDRYRQESSPSRSAPIGTAGEGSTTRARRSSTRPKPSLIERISGLNSGDDSAVAGAATETLQEPAHDHANANLSSPHATRRRPRPSSQLNDISLPFSTTEADISVSSSSSANLLGTATTATLATTLADFETRLSPVRHPHLHPHRQPTPATVHEASLLLSPPLKTPDISSIQMSRHTSVTPSELGYGLLYPPSEVDAHEVLEYEDDHEEIAGVQDRSATGQDGAHAQSLASQSRDVHVSPEPPSYSDTDVESHKAVEDIVMQEDVLSSPGQAISGGVKEEAENEESDMNIHSEIEGSGVVRNSAPIRAEATSTVERENPAEVPLQESTDRLAHGTHAPPQSTLRPGPENQRIQENVTIPLTSPSLSAPECSSINHYVQSSANTGVLPNPVNRTQLSMSSPSLSKSETERTSVSTATPMSMDSTAAALQSSSTFPPVIPQASVPATDMPVPTLISASAVSHPPNSLPTPPPSATITASEVIPGLPPSPTQQRSPASADPSRIITEHVPQAPASTSVPSPSSAGSLAIAKPTASSTNTLSTQTPTIPIAIATSSATPLTSPQQQETIPSLPLAVAPTQPPNPERTSISTPEFTSAPAPVDPWQLLLTETAMVEAAWGEVLEEKEKQQGQEISHEQQTHEQEQEQKEQARPEVVTGTEAESSIAVRTAASTAAPNTIGDSSNAVVVDEQIENAPQSESGAEGVRSAESEGITSDQTVPEKEQVAADKITTSEPLTNTNTEEANSFENTDTASQSRVVESGLQELPHSSTAASASVPQKRKLVAEVVISPLRATTTRSPSAAPSSAMRAKVDSGLVGVSSRLASPTSPTPSPAKRFKFARVHESGSGVASELAPAPAVEESVIVCKHGGIRRVVSRSPSADPSLEANTNKTRTNFGTPDLYTPRADLPALLSPYRPQPPTRPLHGPSTTFKDADKGKEKAVEVPLVPAIGGFSVSPAEDVKTRSALRRGGVSTGAGASASMSPPSVRNVDIIREHGRRASFGSSLPNELRNTVPVTAHAASVPPPSSSELHTPMRPFANSVTRSPVIKPLTMSPAVTAANLRHLLGLQASAASAISTTAPVSAASSSAGEYRFSKNEGGSEHAPGSGDSSSILGVKRKRGMYLTFAVKQEEAGLEDRVPGDGKEYRGTNGPPADKKMRSHEYDELELKEEEDEDVRALLRGAPEGAVPSQGEIHNQDEGAHFIPIANLLHSNPPQILDTQIVRDDILPQKHDAAFTPPLQPSPNTTQGQHIPHPLPQLLSRISSSVHAPNARHPSPNSQLDSMTTNTQFEVKVSLSRAAATDVERNYSSPPPPVDAPLPGPFQITIPVHPPYSHPTSRIPLSPPENSANTITAQPPPLRERLQPRAPSPQGNVQGLGYPEQVSSAEPIQHVRSLQNRIGQRLREPLSYRSRSRSRSRSPTARRYPRESTDGRPSRPPRRGSDVGRCDSRSPSRGHSREAYPEEYRRRDYPVKRKADTYRPPSPGFSSTSEIRRAAGRSRSPPSRFVLSEQYRYRRENRLNSPRGSPNTFYEEGYENDPRAIPSSPSNRRFGEETRYTHNYSQERNYRTGSHSRGTSQGTSEARSHSRGRGRSRGRSTDQRSPGRGSLSARDSPKEAARDFAREHIQQRSPADNARTPPPVYNHQRQPSSIRDIAVPSNYVPSEAEAVIMPLVGSWASQLHRPASSNNRQSQENHERGIPKEQGHTTPAHRRSTQNNPGSLLIINTASTSNANTALIDRVSGQRSQAPGASIPSPRQDQQPTRSFAERLQVARSTSSLPRPNLPRKPADFSLRVDTMKPECERVRTPIERVPKQRPSTPLQSHSRGAASPRRGRSSPRGGRGRGDRGAKVTNNSDRSPGYREWSQAGNGSPSLLGRLGDGTNSGSDARGTDRGGSRRRGGRRDTMQMRSPTEGGSIPFEKRLT